MKRKGPLKRKKPIRRQSDAGADYDADYRAATILVHERSGGRCEIRSIHQCGLLCTDSPHHRKMRSQGGSNDIDNLLDVCPAGHHWIHRVLTRSDAYLLGLLIPRDMPEYPYGERVRT